MIGHKMNIDRVGRPKVIRNAEGQGYEYVTGNPLEASRSKVSLCALSRESIVTVSDMKNEI